MKAEVDKLGAVVVAILLIALGAAGWARAAGAADGPYPEGAPWPVMRGDLANSGRARLMAPALDPTAPRRPVRWTTGNGIFSTPILDVNEIIYVGSADQFFYALDPRSGKILWKFDVGGLIDSAAAISADGVIHVPAGDAKIHALDRDGHELWAFDVLNDRPKGLHSFSTNYWFEGNATIGPDGAIYAGNDDFYFYALEPGGALRWVRQTGFLIWTAAAFSEDGAVYFGGADMRLWALDQKTGKLRWKRDLKNPLVASPAVGPDGTIYQGSFSGKVHALEPRHGKILWTVATGGHVYGSAAVSDDGAVYVASTDGLLYALDAGTGQINWTFYAGDAIRCSPALGPDPENKDPYLIYFGGGDGHVCALEPDGDRRWSYDALLEAAWKDFPNINASPALGTTGLAVAMANGDVVWVPYRYYLEPDAAGVSREPGDGFAPQGVGWYLVTPGGLIDRAPLSPDPGRPTPLEVHAGQALALRMIVRENGQTLRGKLVPASVTAQAAPDFAKQVLLLGDKPTAIVVPDELLAPGAVHDLTVRAEAQGPSGDRVEAAAYLRLRVRGDSGPGPAWLEPGQGFEITHMSAQQPAILPSLDQIGMASQVIPFAVVRSDPASGQFVAWAVQRFGDADEGGDAGVPDRRILLYAFAGQAKGGHFRLEARDCLFEESAFPLPLDRFRLAGRLGPDGVAEQDSCLLVDWKPEGILGTMTKLTMSTEEQGAGKQSWLGSVFESENNGGFLRSLALTGPTVIGYLVNKVWVPWDFYNPEGRFIGLGVFRMKPLPPDQTRAPQDLAVARFEYLPAQNQVVAEVVGPVDLRPSLVIAVLLVDPETGEPVPIGYNGATQRLKLEDGTRRASLTLPPRDLKGRELTAYLMANLAVIDEITIEVAK